MLRKTVSSSRFATTGLPSSMSSEAFLVDVTRTFPPSIPLETQHCTRYETKRVRAVVASEAAYVS